MPAFFTARLTRSALLGGLALGLAVPALGQADDGEIDTVSQPVVQAIPGAPGMRLNTALGRLARNPRDLTALVDAGQASAAMGDADAAIGFFRRADQLKPGDANIKANLAGAHVLAEDPYNAIPLFIDAERSGPIDPRLLSARGLAYDLVGDNELAQRYYRQALSVGPDDETLRRLAISQAISGDKRAMEITLSPLLQKQDKAAWRSRAFAFAILGQQAEAEAIVRANLPDGPASGMIAYLRYMPRLTAAQKAAAANLGHFPRAAEIGRDDPRIAAFVRPKAALAVADKTLPPAPAASGRNDRRSRQAAAAAAAKARTTPAPAPSPAPTRYKPPEPQPVRVAVVTPTPTQTVGPASTPAPVPAPAPAPAPVRAASGPGFGSFDTAQPAASGFDLKQVPVQPSPAPAPAPAPAPPPPPAPAPAKPRNLADVFADLTPPSREIEPVAGAVDLRRLAATRPKAADDARTVTVSRGKDTKSPAATQPSRIWVQIATSRDKPGLSADFRRFTRGEPELFKGRKGFTSAWGQATRLLTGPFETEKAANVFVAQLKKAGMTGSFTWTSPAGQVVDPLPAGR